MKKKSNILVLLLFAAMLTVTACTFGATRGSGDLITESRQVSNFDRISLSGVGEVVVAQGANESLSIETDDNIMKHVKAEVKDGTLELGFEDGVNFIDPTRLVFYVGVDDLAVLTISGSGDIESDMLETSRLEITISGSGDVLITNLTASGVTAKISGSGEIDLTGDAAEQVVIISGAGNYLSGDMCSESVTVNISGSGDATVCATETLDSNISGSGSVNYYGQPLVNSSGSGSGKINSLGEN